MMRTTLFPMRSLSMRPAFWGVERDFKDVVDSIEYALTDVGSTLANDYKETEQAYFMAIDLPGVHKSKLEIQVEGERLLINAQRKSAFAEGDENFQKISKSVMLPKLVDVDKIQAHCEDGVLYLVFPKIEKAKPKKIEIIEGEAKISWKELL